jgi:anti-sigma B factor antagonist
MSKHPLSVTDQSVPFDVQVSSGPDGHTLTLNGQLDIYSAGELKATLLEFSQPGIGSMTLDLRGLTFLDSTGLYMILFAKELADRQGYELSLIPGSPTIQRVFELTELVDVLPFEHEEREARL